MKSFLGWLRATGWLAGVLIGGWLHAAPVTASINCTPAATAPEPIGNRFGSVNIYHYLGTTPDERMFHEWAEAMPPGWLREHYPWLREVVIYGASGGSYLGRPKGPEDVEDAEFNRDPFKHPEDRSVLDDYDFEPLIRGCRNIIRQGLRPSLKLTSVPMKYSHAPKIDYFRLNTRPPADYAVYARYISALAGAMVKAFGIEEVSHWRWMIGVEFDNKMLWAAEDDSPDSSLKAFCDCYDWTVQGLEQALGARLGPIGTHAMADPRQSFWNVEHFIEHCRKGKNAATGQIGSRLDYFGTSVYDVAPIPKLGGAELQPFNDRVARLRSALDQNGYCRVPIEVAEGGIAFGRDEKWLWQGLAVAGSFDASLTAVSFEKMLDGGVAGWTRWPILRTAGLFQGIETAGTRSLALIYRLADDHRLDTILHQSPTGHLEMVSAISPDRSVVRLLAFHHSSDLTHPEPAGALTAELQGLPFQKTALVKIWKVDAHHADFWPQWEKDRSGLHLPASDYVHSLDQADVAHALNNPQAVAFWRSREPDYTKLAQQPPPETSRISVTDGKARLELTLPGFSVQLVEISQASNG